MIAVLTGRDLGRGRLEADPEQDVLLASGGNPADQHRWLARLQRAGFSVAARQGALRRRGGRDRGGGDAWRRRRTARNSVMVDYEPLPCVTFAPRAPPSRMRQRLHERPWLECLHRCRGRRRRGDRDGIRARRACRQARRHGCRASPARRWSRAPQSATTMPRPANTPSTPATARRVRLHKELAHRARRARGQCAPGDPRCRRQLRHPRCDFCRATAGGLGCAQGRPPGEMDLRPQRSVAERLPGPRSRGRGGARARRRRQFSRDARRQRRQSRRAHRQLLDGAEGRRDHVEHLSRAVPRISVPAA